MGIQTCAWFEKELPFYGLNVVLDNIKYAIEIVVKIASSIVQKLLIISRKYLDVHPPKW